MRNNKDKAIEKARKSMELSGFRINKDQDELVRKQLNGKISEEEFLKEARKRLKRRSE
ncbi:antitoxin VbhA family protein [Bacillus luti]|uniref:antitoxin VbhA family protein n=1 Tax=Bacillus luti TaxID=2026191 RepID=UPI0012E88293|nr:antitoxin VbhA family protein [Bacillus luti]